MRRYKYKLIAEEHTVKMCNVYGSTRILYIDSL
jgi:hypothetical protein